MDRVRRDVGDRVELAPGERFLEARKLLADLVLGAEGGEPLGNDIDAADDAHARDGGEVPGMLVGHAAGAENKQAHGSFP